MRCSRRAADVHGFTLLEVVVALAIAMVAVAVLVRAVPQALTGARVAADTGEATLRARARLDALSNGPLTPGERLGDDGGGFAFLTRVTPLAALRPTHPVLVPGAAYATGTALYDVAVTVSWQGGVRAVSLRTQLIGPAQP